MTLFGQPVPGIRNTPAPELAHLFRPRISSDPLEDDVVRVLDVGPGQIERLLVWWAERLNELFGLVLDPAGFTDGEGRHDPRSHFGTLISLDRLFSTLQALLAASARDEFARRAFLFDVIDLLEGLRFGDSRTLFTLRRARSALGRVRSSGAGAALAAVPACERAVEALQRVSEGFYLSERRTDKGLLVRRKDGSSWEEVSMENAVADYLRVLRNSTHSFMGTIRDERDLSLLSAHTGEIPRGLPELALLHVMDLLLRPEALSRPTATPSGP